MESRSYSETEVAALRPDQGGNGSEERTGEVISGVLIQADLIPDPAKDPAFLDLLRAVTQTEGLDVAIVSFGDDTAHVDALREIAGQSDGLPPLITDRFQHGNGNIFDDAAKSLGHDPTEIEFWGQGVSLSGAAGSRLRPVRIRDSEALAVSLEQILPAQAASNGQ